MDSRSGGIPERSKGTDCKSVGSAFAGSNPAPATLLVRFSIDGQQTPGAVRVIPHGELDVATAPQLTAALDAAHGQRQRVLLDLFDVDFIDSSGITAVFLAWQHSRREGWAFGMTNGNDKVMDVFEAVGLVDVLPFV